MTKEEFEMNLIDINNECLAEKRKYQEFVTRIRSNRLEFNGDSFLTDEAFFLIVASTKEKLNKIDEIYAEKTAALVRDNLDSIIDSCLHFMDNIEKK